MFREPGSGSFGPAPLSGKPRGAVQRRTHHAGFNSIYQCRFGSDNHTAFFFATTVAEPRDQVYAVDTAAPGTPTVVSRPLVSGESFENWWVARTAPRHGVGTRGIGPQVAGTASRSMRRVRLSRSRPMYSTTEACAGNSIARDSCSATRSVFPGFGFATPDPAQHAECQLQHVADACRLRHGIGAVRVGVGSPL